MFKSDEEFIFTVKNDFNKVKTDSINSIEKPRTMPTQLV